MQVVEGEQAGLIVPGFSGRTSNGVAGPGVQLAAKTERESVVGAVAEEGIAKRQMSLRIVHNEGLETHPRRITLVGHVFDDIGQQLGGEGLAQHRHAAQQLTVEHGEPVDAGDDDVLDRVGQGTDGAPLQHRRHQLPDEERVPP